MTNVLITGVGSLIGQGIIQAIKLVDEPCRIVGTDYFNSAVGLYWVDQGYIMPDILKDSVSDEQWLDVLIPIVKKEEIDIIFIGLDFEVEIFAQYKERIESETKAKVIVGDYQKVLMCRDKWQTAKFLKENGFPYPESTLPENIDAFVKDNPYPYIVKPRIGFRSRYLSEVNNDDELKSAIAKCPNPVIQQKVGTIDEEYTCGCIYLDDEVVSTISLKRFLKDGNTHRAINADQSEEMDAFIKDVGSTLKLYGPCNFQLRKTKDAFVIFEINPRFSGTTGIRAMFGENEVATLFNRVLNQESSPLMKSRRGVILRYFEDQFVPMDEYNQWEAS